MMGDGGDLKVTDRRMFTPDGRLREPFEREFAQASSPASEPSDAPVEVESAPALPEAEPSPELSPASSAPEAPNPAPDGAPSGLPPLPAEPPPGMLELVDFLAQLALASIGEVPFADGRLTRDLDAARFYIDLIGSFHQRYALRLSAQDLHFLESYLDQLRLRFVARRG